jgi:hypothetical protein
MLVGNTPWAEPTGHDEEFKQFINGYPNNLAYSPWCFFSPAVLEVYFCLILKLILGILNHNDRNRYTITDIENNTWFSMYNSH